MTQTPPSIRVHAHVAIAAAQLSELLLGIEEEGVPVEIEHSDELNPLVLAHQAALASRLGVGIGVSLTYAVTTLEKLPAARPYAASWFNDQQQTDRIIGSNAARLVKRIPLRPICAERKSA